MNAIENYTPCTKGKILSNNKGKKAMEIQGKKALTLPILIIP